VASEEPELLTDIRDFITLLYLIFRHNSSEWIGSPTESDVGVQFAIGSLDLAIYDFTFLKHYFKCKNRSLENEYLTSVILENKLLYPWYVILYFFPQIPMYHPLLKHN